MIKELKPFVISLGIILSLFLGVTAHAQTSFFNVDLLPTTDAARNLGTTTGAFGQKAWLRVVAKSFFDTDASDGCATFSSNILTSTGVACGSGSGSTFPFTVTGYGVATSTAVGFTNGLLSNSSTTLLGSLNLLGTTGTVLSDFCVAITGGAGLCDGTDANSGGGGGGNIATSSAETSGRVPIWSSTGATPATLSGGVAGFSFNSTLSKLTITNYEATTGTTTSATSTSFFATNASSTNFYGAGLGVCQTGNVLTYDGAGKFGCAADANSGGTVTSVTATTPIISSGGATPNLTFVGLATTSQPSSSNLLVSNGGAGVYGAATSSLTATSPLSLSQPISVIGTSASVLTCSTCVLTTRALTIAGTANQITSSAGAQDLSADRTWTLSIPTDFRVSSTTISGKTLLTNATATNLDVPGLLTFNGVTGSTWASFCSTITGGSGLCDGVDDTSAGGSAGYDFPSVGTDGNSTSTRLIFGNGFMSQASSTFTGNVIIANYATATKPFVIMNGNLGTPASSWWGSLNPASVIFCQANVGDCDQVFADAADASNRRGANVYRRSRGTLAVPTALINGDNIGTFAIASPYDGTNFINTAEIVSSVCGNVATGEVQTCFQFLTGSTGSRTTKLTVDNNAVSAGTSTPSFLGALTVGSSTAQQILLSANTSGMSNWAFRNAGGIFYLSTTTVSGSATSTKSAFSISANGIPAFSSLVSCDTIDTDANGVFTCGTDATGAAGSAGYDFPSVQTWGNATSTTLGLLNGFLSTASSTINASTTVTGVLTASGGIYGNLTGTASLATALAANGANCSAGQFPLGVDASGAVETCTDAWTEAENTTAAYAKFPFTPDTNFGAVANATGTPVWFKVGLQASSTSHFVDFDARNTTTTSATTTNFASTNASTTNLVVSGIQSAIVLTGTTGITSAYGGTTPCSNQFIRSLSALGAASCATVGAADVSLANLTATDNTLTFSGTYNGSTARTIGINLGNPNTWTGLQTITSASTTNLTAGSYFNVPVATSFANFTKGSIAFDSTNGNLIMGTTTATSATQHVVIASATTTLYSFAIASTSPDMSNGGVIELPAHPLAQVITGVICKADAGTSVVINISDSSGATDSNTVTCTTTSTQFQFTSNNSYAAYAVPRLEIGALTGTVDRVAIRLVGYRTTD